ncbi:MAG TPA: sigma 54-interacting transcriptional regulator [Gemmataceae bacterium]|nr:sigma 54-interacting transcriptional regulator [Gemmataceae bacterium]
MPADGTAFLVVRRDDGFGDVFSLAAADRYTLGRAATNRIVLKDELCSREHAEVFHGNGCWRVRDLNSLNGTRVNGERLTAEIELTPGDDVHLGKTHLLFVEDMSQLPDVPTEPRLPEEDEGSVSIKKRLGQTRFLTPVPADKGAGDTLAGTPPSRHNLSRDLALLYRLALDMGSATSYEDLVRVVLDGLLEAIPAEVGAVLTVKEGGALDLTAHRHRDPSMRGYTRVSEYLSREVLHSREAVLAENVARDRYLRNRESLSDLGITSVICAPVSFGDRVLGLIHLYCTDPHKALDGEDLEFAVAVAKQLGNVIHQMQRQESLAAEIGSLRDQLCVESELIGDSSAMATIESQIGRVAGTNATVLIRGESGVGKELVARAIHYSSHRKEGPFVCLNCAALTETLLESELFGHEKGSFTGATEKKVGKFEAADRGSIFLDEIGEMNVGTQAKLLRILEGHSFERVGGSVPIKVDVRMVAATNQPLEQAVHEGRFRRDLFFRLQVVEIRVPPLRERRRDIPQLADHFLKRFVRETGRKIKGFTPSAMQKMEAYDWPGNVRELRNVVERAVALSNGPMLDAPDIWLSSLDAAGPAEATGAAYQPMTLQEIERIHIQRTLEHTEWNKSRTAEILDIERSTLDRKIKLYELKR